MWTGVATLLVLTALLTAQKPEAAESLLQAAIKKEIVDGNLSAAIEGYKKALAAAKANRAVAAMALVHMAGCYQKKGDAEARKIYEQVVQEYADQKDAVAMARTRLAATTQPKRQSNTLLWSGSTNPKVYVRGRVSPDARYLSYTDWESGDLALHEIASGARRRLTDTKQEKSNVNVMAEGSAFSTDGKQIVYNWYDNGKAELRLASVTGDPSPRRLYENPDIDWFRVWDWSSDGKWVAVQVYRTDRTHQIGLISIPDGSLRVLKSVDTRGPVGMFFSPDSKYLGYDLPESDTSQEHDIFVLSIDGNREIPAVAHRGQDIMMGWSPDGKRLLFASDWTGSIDLWGLPFADGKPQGAPELLKASIGQVESMGLTRSGALYYVTKTGIGVPTTLYVASFDFGAGKLTSPATEVTHDYLESNYAPRWSPDGKYLAHVSQRVAHGGTNRAAPGGRGGNTLVIRSAETYHVIRELRVKLSYFYGIHWLFDGRSVLATGADVKGGQGIFRIDAQTGDVSPLHIEQPRGDLRLFSVSPDGRSLYFSRVLPGGKGSVLIQQDLASGSEKELMRRPSLLYAEPVSPDGQYVVVASADPSSGSWSKLLLPTAGGEPQEIMRGPVGVRLIGAPWARDSRSFFTLKSYDGAQHRDELWRVPINGGVPVKVEGLSRLFNVHPDGQRIVYELPETLPQKQEVWVLENFLPTTNASK
jgi:Tol biopolymer transport system component